MRELFARVYVSSRFRNANQDMSVTLQECQLGLARPHASAYIAHGLIHMTPLCYRDVADEDAIMSVEVGGDLTDIPWREDAYIVLVL